MEKESTRIQLIKDIEKLLITLFLLACALSH
jgi:hypothetical protein